MKVPVVIFGFNRPDAFKRLVDSLKTNDGLEERNIIVYVDGPRNDGDRAKISQVIRLAGELTTNVIASSVNKGLAGSIIFGVSEVMKKYGMAIILEDDLVLMPSFLNYMDMALEKYKKEKSIFSICGYGLQIHRPTGYTGDVYLSRRSSSWGWATWADRWDSIDWELKDWNLIKRSKEIRRGFNKGGSDMFGMLCDYKEGKNNSWAIRFCFNQYLQNKYSVHPFRSLVANEGFGSDATNCRQKYSRFKISLNQSDNYLFSMPQVLHFNSHIDRQLSKYHSLPMRIYSRFRKILNV